MCMRRAEEVIISNCTNSYAFNISFLIKEHCELSLADSAEYTSLAFLIKELCSNKPVIFWPLQITRYFLEVEEVLVNPYFPKVSNKFNVLANIKSST